MFGSYRPSSIPALLTVNHDRLLEPIGNIPLAKAQARYHAQSEDVAMAA
ncbi:Mobile element protein [Azospirillum melinis]